MKVCLRKTAMALTWLPCLLLINMSQCTSVPIMKEEEDVKDFDQGLTEVSLSKFSSKTGSNHQTDEAKIKHVLGKLQTKAYDNLEFKDYQEELGEGLYLALKHNSQDFINEITKSMASAEQKSQLGGYALYLAVKNDNLKDIFVQVYNLEALPQNQVVDLQTLAIKKQEEIRRSFQDPYEYDKMVKYMVHALLCTLELKEKQHSQALQKALNELHATNPLIVSYNFELILSSLMYYLIRYSSQDTASQIFHLLSNILEIPDSILNKAKEDIKKVKVLNNIDQGILEARIVKFQQQKKEIKKQPKYQKKLCHAISLRNDKKITEAYCKFSKTLTREQGYYSNSEEENGTHFPGVHNSTKYKAYRAKTDNRKLLVDNYANCYEEIIPRKLKQDAQEIHQASGSKPQVTILCIALRQKGGCVKKFAFTNTIVLSSQVPNSSISKFCKDSKNAIEDHNTEKTTDTLLVNIIAEQAQKKQYHMIRSQQAHAEGGFIQFLQERPTRYTHILGLGASRDHCKLCHIMLKSLLGPSYVNLSASNPLEKYINYEHWYIPPALEKALGGRKSVLLTDLQETAKSEQIETITKYKNSATPFNKQPREWRQGLGLFKFKGSRFKENSDSELLSSSESEEVSDRDNGFQEKSNKKSVLEKKRKRNSKKYKSSGESDNEEVSEKKRKESSSESDNNSGTDSNA